MIKSNHKKCSTQTDCLCLNCLKVKIPENCKIDSSLQNTYCIDVSTLLEDIKMNIGDSEADEFWLSLLSLRTYFDKFHKDIKKIIDKEQYYRRIEILSSSMLIEWDGCEIFKRIFIKYLKLRNLHPNIDIYLNGQIYFYVDFRCRKIGSKINWIDQEDIFCTIGLNYGKTSSSNLNKKFETKVPFNGIIRCIRQDFFDIIRLVSKHHYKNLEKIGEDMIPRYRNVLKTFLKNIDNMIYAKPGESLKILKNEIIPSLNFMFGLRVEFAYEPENLAKINLCDKAQPFKDAIETKLDK